MKKLTLTLLFSSFFYCLYAQTSAKLDVRPLFSHLNTSYLSTDRLADYTLPFSNLPFFSGLYDTTNNYNNWEQIYYEMYNAAAFCRSNPFS